MPMEDKIEIDIPDNSYLMKQLEENHPQVLKFERKYENLDWRSKFYGGKK